MGRMFGTDGVRGIANKDLTCELAYQLGRAGAYVLAQGAGQKPNILVGRDTRISGDMLEAALIAGICSVGANATVVGVLPTPGIAYLTRVTGADAGVVISASHNPVEDNGIKFFSSAGFKLPDETEDRIEAVIRGDVSLPEPPTGESVGRRLAMPDAASRYIEFLVSTANARLDGMTVALDCANGASSAIAPVVFERLGARVIATHNVPDGTNINKNCGSTHPENLQHTVKAHKAQAGLAFDGDADRLIAVDDAGELVDGDHIMALCGKHMKERGTLKKNTVVATVMSNMGLDIAGRELGLDIKRTAVGDRYVLELMLEEGYNLGGEQSGHIIFLDHNPTGDGILTGIQLLVLLAGARVPLSKLSASVMTTLPQTLVGARVKDDAKRTWKDNAAITAEIAAIEVALHGNGRVFVRPSGTEPLIRVLVEGPQAAYNDQAAARLKALLESL